MQIGIGRGEGNKKAEAAEGEKEELVLQDKRLLVKYVEQESKKKRGKSLEDAEEVENELKRVEDELYLIILKAPKSSEKNIQSYTKIEDLKLMAKDLNRHLVVIIMLLIQGKADKLQLIRSCWNDSARESVTV
ncbi:hypothetical protein Bca101_052452 [Brassica carinata]